MTIATKIGGFSFILWGILHIVGGLVILSANLGNPGEGFWVYQNAASNYDALASAILNYFAFLLICIGGTVIFVGIKLNLRNSQTGLTINTIITALTEIGLVFFLLLPGFVSVVEASLGLSLFLLAVIFGGIACNAAHEREKQSETL